MHSLHVSDVLTSQVENSKRAILRKGFGNLCGRRLSNSIGCSPVAQKAATMRENFFSRLLAQDAEGQGKRSAPSSCKYERVELC